MIIVNFKRFCTEIKLALPGLERLIMQGGGSVQVPIPEIWAR